MIIVEHDERGNILSVVSYPVSENFVVELYKDRVFLPQGFFVDYNKMIVRDGEVVYRSPE
ncbi:hypothetical protein CCU68_18855 [Pseudomonas gingeri NCPPB 3146 = LMG 5327]|uniref:Uncharacterized protein n=1 Tax=Pseudomonas gingeri NCPPB 3146 = LMG 5327 TaxID=707248 RepID=A0ABX4Y1P0_9PSED|nr:hypothetical protein CCU68_18855 [Pseudomonas gingeri NCPPB 3146 = LMG 5327]